MALQRPLTRELRRRRRSILQDLRAIIRGMGQSRTLQELLEDAGYTTAGGASQPSKKRILRDGKVVAELKASEVVDWLEKQEQRAEMPASSLGELGAHFDAVQQKHHPGSWPVGGEPPSFLEDGRSDDELEEP